MTQKVLTTGIASGDEINYNFTELYTRTKGIFNILSFTNGEAIYDGINYATTALKNSIADTAINGGIVLIPTTEDGSTYLIDSDITTPSNVTLQIAPGAKLKGNLGTESLIINGGIIAGLYQIFDNIVVSGTPNVEFKPEWIGRTVERAKLKTKSVCVPVYLGYTLQELSDSILRAKFNGADFVILSVKFLNGTVGSPSSDPMDDNMFLNDESYKISDVVDYCNSINIDCSIKMHIENEKHIAPTNVATWYTNWTARCSEMADICIAKGVSYLGVSNEMLLMTQTNKSEWQALYTTLKTNYPTIDSFIGVSMTEAETCIIYDVFDINGVNVYNSFTDKGINETDENMRDAWYGTWGGRDVINTIIDIKRFDKPVWITEIGCGSFDDSLIYTASYSDIGGYNEAVQYFFYEYMFDVIWNCTQIDLMSIWSIGHIGLPKTGSVFSYQEKTAEAIVAQYWGGEVGV